MEAAKCLFQIRCGALKAAVHAKNFALKGRTWTEEDPGAWCPCRRHRNWMWRDDSPTAGGKLRNGRPLGCVRSFRAEKNRSAPKRKPLPGKCATKGNCRQGISRRLLPLHRG